MSIAKTAALRIAGAKSFDPADVEEWRKGWRVVAGAAVGMGTGIGLYLFRPDGRRGGVLHRCCRVRCRRPGARGE